MLYVQQSLGPNEDILFPAYFHWMYTVSALFWIFLGFLAAAAIMLASVWWYVGAEIRHNFHHLPMEYYPQAWNETVMTLGKGKTMFKSYVNIIWLAPSVVRLGALATFVLGLLLFLHMMIVRATTEIAVTTDRVVYKKGLIARYVGEISIDRIEGVLVFQSILGRFLGYGRVVIRGMGVGEVILPPIANPITFRKAIQEAKSGQERGGVSRKEDEF